MDVADRLPAKFFLADSQFVELRFVHAHSDPMQLLYLFGLVETAAELKNTTLREKLYQRIETSKDRNAMHARSIVNFLMRRDVPAGRKLALWGRDMTRFFLLQALVAQEHEHRLVEFIERTFGVTFTENGQRGAEEELTVHWGRVDGKLALLYTDYAVDSFAAWNCGHLYFRYEILASMQRLASSSALSHSQFLSSSLRCDSCLTPIGAQLFTDILERSSENGVAVLNELMKQEIGPLENTQNCLLCCGRLKGEALYSESCDCKVCLHCAAISSLRREKFECPVCKRHYATEQQHRMSSVCAGIAGICRKAPRESVHSPSQEEPGSHPKAERCSCGNLLDRSSIYCDDTCTCSACILKQYITTRKTTCRSGKECFGLFQCDIQCSYCVRVFRMTETNLSKYPCGFCSCGAVLCCFCIDTKEGQCPICFKPVQLLEDMNHIREVQQLFGNGCFCGEKERATEKMLCTHMVHKKCLGEVFFCRVCKVVIKERPAPKLLRDYLSEF